MGKVFDEGFEKGTKIDPSELGNCLHKYAIEYIASEREIFSKISSTVRDAVLLDALNYLGFWWDVYYGFFKEDLYGAALEKVEFNPDWALKILYMLFARYICCIDIVKSVLEDPEMYKCDEEFDADDGMDVLVDFINYVAEKNGYDRVFTKRDLCEKYQRDTYVRDMKQLGSFLELTRGYSERLQNGEDIDSIYSELTTEYDFEYDLKDDKYYYLNRKSKIREVDVFKMVDIERELYALAYAYAKMNPNYQTVSLPDIVKKKIKEMKIDNK